MGQFVSYFLSYVSYLNWLTVGKVLTKIKRVNFLLRHGVVRKSFFLSIDRVILKLNELRHGVMRSFYRLYLFKFFCASMEVHEPLINESLK